MRKPVIGIPADRRLLGSHWFHCVGEKYIAAIAQAADAVPVLVPALGERYLQEWLESFDGILFTGSPSNVEPHRYQGPASAPGTLHDPERDATTLPMIKGAVDAGLPVFGICRGFQEMNVAFGGSLIQKLQEQPGHLDHREDATQPSRRYAPAHGGTRQGGHRTGRGRRRSRSIRCIAGRLPPADNSSQRRGG
jgi:putative glutamine amidotransferase